VELREKRQDHDVFAAANKLLAAVHPKKVASYEPIDEPATEAERQDRVYGNV